MKKIITILAMATTLSLASASIDMNLKYSMRGQEVSELQDFLIDKGFLTTTPSGFFGLLTLKAVKAYQLSEGLPGTGFVGLMTRTVINEDLVKQTLSSTEAEARETGTSTPVVIAPPVSSYYSMPAPSTPVVQPVEEIYTLEITKIRANQKSFNFVPVAVLNGKFIEVSSCSIIGRNETSKIWKGESSLDENSALFMVTSGDYPNRLNNYEKGIISCTLVNGKVLSN